MSQNETETVSQSKIEIQNSKRTSGPLTDSLTHSLATPHGSYRVKEERALIQRRTVEPANSLALQPSGNPYECVISAAPTASACLGQRMRNGKIARLPKLERDMVNKLLHNNVPHSKIVWALPSAK